MKPDFSKYDRTEMNVEPGEETQSDEWIKFCQEVKKKYSIDPLIILGLTPGNVIALFDGKDAEIVALLCAAMEISPGIEEIFHRALQHYQEVKRRVSKKV